MFGGDVAVTRTTENAAWSAPHLPLTAVVDVDAMWVGGRSVAELVAEYGSPLQIVDAADLDARSDAYVTALDALARPARAVFATKA